MATTDTVRERLLSRLPQPEEVTAYRQEVAVLLARHKKALFWDSLIPKVLGVGSAVFYSMGIWIAGKQPHSPLAPGLYVLAAAMFLIACIDGAQYRISRDQVGLLKEIKQLQVQVLELQASLRRTNDE